MNDNNGEGESEEEMKRNESAAKLTGTMDAIGQ